MLRRHGDQLTIFVIQAHPLPRPLNSHATTLRDFVSSTTSPRPSIAKRMLVDILCPAGVWGLGHTIVDFKLLHEAVVGSAYGTAFTQLRQGFVRWDVIFAHKVGHYKGS